MKRFILVLALSAMMAMPMFAERVTPETARKVATTFLSNNGVKADALTDLSKAAGFENLYIFTTESSFIVMSADDCVKPILGYSLTGLFVAESIPDNVRSWLQDYNDEIQFALESKMQATTETNQLWKALAEGKDNVEKATSVVTPLIQTQWNQNGMKYYGSYVVLFNNLCPEMSGVTGGHAVTGCVATAMAQIMKYWKFPTHGIDSHSYTWNNQTLSADFGSTNYDWDNMTNTYNNSSTETQKTAVATLMYHCGVSVNMDYGSSSNASTAAVVNALKTYFNYSPNIEYKTKSNYDNDVWIAMVKAELDAKRPLQYRGRSSSGGHSFVCDGYNSSDKFHFNWGWAGAYDGYFSLDNLDTGANNQTGQGNGIYTNDQAAIFGIQPVQCSASQPTNLTYELTGSRNLTLNWTAANGAVSYNIYRSNNNYVGNSATNSFTGLAPFGTSVYYIRSVDANGNISLSSNTVTVTVAYPTPIVNDLEATLSGNNVNLSWENPEWCYPETPSATLNYGTDELHYSWAVNYYAHRYLASDLAQHAGKAVYKVSTFIEFAGTYSIYIYTSTQINQPKESNLAFSKIGTPITNSENWYEFILDEPIILTGSDDLWVVLKQENTGQTYPVPSFDLSEHNINAFYKGYSSPTNLSDCNTNYNCAWFINTYLTDGTYTYNLYRDGVKIAENLSGTTYNTTLNNNAANLFTIKTKYYGGESDNSNMEGFAKGNALTASLEMGENDKMTVTENSILSVSGTLSNTRPSNLVLEDGAQLFHSDDNVAATVKKDITSYNNGGGWNFIASPVGDIATNQVTGLLSSTSARLFAYDEPSHYWMYNTGIQAPFTSLASNQGYLYANADDVTLEFSGTLVPSGSVTINGLSHSATELNGFNLVGNPFACNATINRDCYVIEDGQVVLASNNKVFSPCEGAFVKATNANESVTFTKVTFAKGSISEDCIDLVITRDNSILDRVRLRLGEGIGMEKFSLDDERSQISLWQNGRDFAVAYANGANELPLSFKAAENGTYTLAIEVEDLKLDYLHLIDNMTGEDVDLLATKLTHEPVEGSAAYTFEAKTTDYASRFRLVFSPEEDGASTGSATFAYFANGEIIITGIADACDASLQVMDMTGRMIVCRGAARHVSTIGMTPGIYVLRLINGDSVRSQKIVIE